MDHLTTPQARRERWYSKVEPHYLPVVEAVNTDDLTTAIADRLYAIPSAWMPRDDIHSLLHTTLDQHGFFIVSQAVDTETCAQIRQAAMDWYETATRLGQDHDFPTALEGGILADCGAGHCTSQWMARQAVRYVFEAFWDQPVATSLDGMVVWPSRRVPTDAGWFHVDQNPLVKPDFCAVQGILNVVGNGGTVLAVGSHQTFGHLVDPSHPCAAFYQQRLLEVDGDGWLEMDPHDETVFGGTMVRPILRPGDLLVWDSRTAHCSYPYTSNERDYTRIANLVTMMPNSKDDTIQKARRHAMANGQTLTHWVDRVHALGAEQQQDEHHDRNARIIEELRKAGLLLDWDDLSPAERELV